MLSGSASFLCAALMSPRRKEREREKDSEKVRGGERERARDSERQRETVRDRERERKKGEYHGEVTSTSAQSEIFKPSHSHITNNSRH